MKRRRTIIGIGSALLLCAAVALSVKVLAGSGFHEVKIHLSGSYSDSMTGIDVSNSNGRKLLPQFATEVSTGYLNNDGTATLEVFAAPIRFLNGNKQWQDIDPRIANVPDAAMRGQGYVYTISADDIKPYYPKSLKTGILLKKSFAFSFGVDDGSNSYARYVSQENILNRKTDMVEYDDAFGKGVPLDVYPSSIGSNVEIRFDRKPASKQLRFWLNADGCHVTLEKGGYISMTTDTKVSAGLGYTTNQVIGIIQAPLLRDKGGSVSYRSTLSLKRVSKGKYIVTLNLDDAFLSGGKTQYPVKSFSTFEIFRDKEPDSPTYSARPELNSYLSNYSVIGNSADYGDGELRIRFLFAKNFNLKSSQIQKASYSVYNFSGNNPKDDLELCTMLDDWCSLATHWDDGLQYGNRTSALKMGSNPILTFDITQEAKKWCDAPDGLAEHKGVLLKSEDEKEGVWNVILSGDNSLYNNRTEVVLEQ